MPSPPSTRSNEENDMTETVTVDAERYRALEAFVRAYEKAELPARDRILAQAYDVRSVS